MPASNAKLARAMPPIKDNFLPSDAILYPLTALRLRIPVVRRWPSSRGVTLRDLRFGGTKMCCRATSIQSQPIQPPTTLIGYSTPGTVGESRVQPARITTRAHIAIALAGSRLREIIMGMWIFNRSGVRVLISICSASGWPGTDVDVQALGEH